MWATEGLLFLLLITLLVRIAQAELDHRATVHRLDAILEAILDRETAARLDQAADPAGAERQSFRDYLEERRGQ